MMRLLALPFVISMSAQAANLSEQPERLPIFRGDSLSSISKTVFGDGTYWPKIWSKDAKMVNPGNSIQFLLGDEEGAPAFAISESDDDIMASPSKAPPRVLAIKPAAAKKGSTELEIPPPKVRPKPVLNLSEIMPSWQSMSARRPGFKNYTVEILPRRKLLPVDREFIPVYVQDSALRPIGEFVQTASDSGLVFEGEEILLRLNSGSGQIGAHYLLLHDGGQLQEGWASDTGHHNGHVIEVLAEIVLISEELAQHESGFDHFRAKVTHAIGVSAKGASVVPGQVTWMNTSPSGEFSNVSAEVIGGNNDNHGMLFGEGDWVFLNRGARDGLAEGQLIWVNSLPRNYETDSPFLLGVKNSSLVKIAKVASEISTGIVLSSKQGLMQHDYANGIPTASNKSDDKSDGTEELKNEPGVGDDIGIDPGTSDVPLDSSDVHELDGGGINP